MAISISPAQTSLLLASVSFMRSSVSGHRDRPSSPGLAKRSGNRGAFGLATIVPHRLVVFTGCPAFAVRDGAGRVRPLASLRLDAALFDHALPFLHFLFDEGCEFCRAHLHDLCALAGELLLHL